MSISTRAMRIHILLAAALMAGSAAWASAEDVVTVKAEGRAAGTDGNAMEQAKQDALRRAVEQACGTFISSQSQTKNYELVYDKALSLAAGFVTGYEIIDRRTADGISYCTVRATVSKASFEKEWARLLHTIEAEGNPRCMMVFVEDNNVDDQLGPKADGVVQSIIENFFIQKGVQMMDKLASEQAQQRDVELAALNDDVRKLAAMAASFKADVVVRGTAEARRAGATQLGGRTLYRWSATITVRAYHADSAQMLMSNTYSETKASVDENAGGDEVLRACAEKHAARILSDVGESWRKRQNIRRVCQLTITNCTRKQFKAFEAQVRKLEGVQEVRLKELVNNVCQIEVDWSYDLERLISRIEDATFPDFSLEVTEQTHDRVTLKLVE